MTDEEFASGLVAAVVRSNAGLYDELFHTTDPASATDPYWQAAAGLFASLGEADRRTFLEVVRQVMVDTVSSTLAIIDGVTDLDGQTAPLELRHGDQVLSGALQDLFLASVEADRER